MFSRDRLFCCLSFCTLCLYFCTDETPRVPAGHPQCAVIVFEAGCCQKSLKLSLRWTIAENYVFDRRIKKRRYWITAPPPGFFSAEHEFQQQAASVVEACRFKFFFAGVRSWTADDSEADRRYTERKRDIAVGWGATLPAFESERVFESCKITLS